MDIHDYLAQTRMLRSSPAFQSDDTAARIVREVVASTLHRPMQIIPVYSSIMSHEVVSLSESTYLVADHHLVEVVRGINALLVRVTAAMELNEPGSRRDAILRGRSNFRSMLLRILSLQLWQRPSVSLALAEKSLAAHDEQLSQMFPLPEKTQLFLREFRFGQELFTYLEEVYRFLYRENNNAYEARIGALAQAFELYKKLLSVWAEIGNMGESPWPAARWKGMGDGDEIEQTAVEDVEAVQHNERPELLMELVCAESAAHDVFTVNATRSEPKDDVAFVRAHCLSEMQVFMAAHYLSAIRRLVTFWKNVAHAPYSDQHGLRELIDQGSKELTSDTRLDSLRFFFSRTFPSMLVRTENHERGSELYGGISEEYRGAKDVFLKVLFPELLRLISADGIMEVIQRAAELERRSDLTPEGIAKQRQQLLGW